MSEQLRDNWSLTRVSILPVFIDGAVNPDKEIELPKQHRILVVGRLEREKNVGFAIQVFMKISHEFPHTRLVIVGDGREKNKLQDQARFLGDQVEFRGWLNSEQLEKEYQKATLLLVPSLYESYGRQILEGVQHGLPVVTSDVGVASEYVQNDKNGYVLPVADEQMFIEKLRYIFGTPEKLTALRQTARQVIVNLPSKEVYLDLQRRSWEHCTIND